MAKDENGPAGDAIDRGEENGEGPPAPPSGFFKKLFGNRKMLLIASAVVLLLIGGGAGFYFFVLGGGGSAPAAAPDAPPTPPQVAYFDVPDLLVNIQTPEGGSAYLKLSVSLEIASDAEKSGLEGLSPRIVDQLQGYLRELRTDDLKGSAGVMRLKEEMLRRVNVAAAPYHVRDVLLKEMVVQ
jgi:flagellar FliL protein